MMLSIQTLGTTAKPAGWQWKQLNSGMHRRIEVLRAEGKASHRHGLKGSQRHDQLALLATQSGSDTRVMSGAQTSTTKPTAMDIIFVAAEVCPWSKTGGLGDVMGALPVALAKRGHRVMVVTPRYLLGGRDEASTYAGVVDLGVRAKLDLGPVGGMHDVGFWHLHRQSVDWVFVDHMSYHRPGNPYGNHNGPYSDNLFRFALLSLAACEAPLLLHIGGFRSGAPPGFPYGQDVVFIANDWHAALVPLYLTHRYRHYNLYSSARSVLLLHNLAHQGAALPECFDGLGLPVDAYPVLDWKMQDDATQQWMRTINLLKGGMVAADQLITVSRAYAWEVVAGRHSAGLHSLLPFVADKMVGIVNGINESEWDPSTDPHIPARYSEGRMGGKALCKLRLQEELGLAANPSAPLLVFIGRLDYQKGPDILLEIVSDLVELGCQIAVLGTGAPDYEARVWEMEARFPEAFRARVCFSVPLSHRLVAGGDMIIMPSRFEPCGLNQMHAMRYGTVPIVAATGGLRDTVDDMPLFITMAASALDGEPQVGGKAPGRTYSVGKRMRDPNLSWVSNGGAEAASSSAAGVVKGGLLSGTPQHQQGSVEGPAAGSSSPSLPYSNGSAPASSFNRPPSSFSNPTTSTGMGMNNGYSSSHRSSSSTDVSSSSGSTNSGQSDYVDAEFDGQSGTGWSFSPITPLAALDAVAAACHVYFGAPASWRRLMQRGMARDSSWNVAAHNYETVLEQLRNRTTVKQKLQIPADKQRRLQQLQQQLSAAAAKATAEAAKEAAEIAAGAVARGKAAAIEKRRQARLMRKKGMAAVATSATPAVPGGAAADLVQGTATSTRTPYYG